MSHCAIVVAECIASSWSYQSEADDKDAVQKSSQDTEKLPQPVKSSKLSFLLKGVTVTFSLKNQDFLALICGKLKLEVWVALSWDLAMVEGIGGRGKGEWVRGGAPLGWNCFVSVLTGGGDTAPPPPPTSPSPSPTHLTLTHPPTPPSPTPHARQCI